MTINPIRLTEVKYKIYIKACNMMIFK